MFEPVSVEKCSSYEQLEINKALDNAIDAIGGLDFVKEGMTIGIKANLVAAMNPDKAVTTHPALLKRLCERIVELGASVIVGDSPGGLFTPAFVKNVYKICGLYELEEAFPGKVKLNTNLEIKDAEFPEAVSIKTFIYTAWLDDVDFIINFSKLKTHAMMGMSCAVKNMFGTIPGTTKPEYHMRFPEENAFANLMVDLNEYFKPALYVVDAIDGMEGNGPTAGEKRHIGLILASKKPYALDMVCADIIGLGINDVQTMKAAYERGLGPKSVDEVEVVGNALLPDVKISDYKKATIHQSITFEGGSAFNNVKSAVVKILFSTKPLVRPSECIGCKKCYETCPAHAITMVTKKVKGKEALLPEIDRNKCIKCFCCQEFCPKGAMKVHENPIGKMINRK